MARSGKTITFATDLLPQEDNTYNLGSDTDNLRWKIFGKLNTNHINQTALIGTCEMAGGDKGANANPRYLPEKWKFNANITVTDGDIITIKTPGAGHDYGTYLSLDSGTNYYPIVLNTNGRYTTHFSTGTAITLRFDSSGSAASMFALNGQNNTTRVPVSGGVWRLLTVYDSGNTNDTSVMYIRIGSATYKTTTKYQRYVLSLIKNETHIIPLNIDKNSSNNDGTTTNNHTLTTDVFDITSYIFVYNTNNTSYAADATVGTGGLWYGHAAVDMRYSFNITTSTFTAHKNVYIKASLQSSTTAKLCTDGNPVTQTLPTTNDGYIYILIGRAYSGYQITLFNQHPIYWHNGTSLQLYQGNYLPLSGGTMTDGVTFVGNQSSAWNTKGILFTNGSRIGESTSGLGIYGAGSLTLRPNSGSSLDSTVGMTIDTTGKVSITKNITSSSTSTGSLVVAGGAGISGALYVGDTATVKTLAITSEDYISHISFARENWSYITYPDHANSALAIGFGLGNNANQQLVISKTGTVRPGDNGTQNLGDTLHYWANVYTNIISSSSSLQIKTNTASSTITTVTFDGSSIIPGTGTSALDRYLGSSTYPWKTIYATTIYANNVSSSASSTLYLNSPASTSIIFTKGGASTSSEMARFDTDKNFVPKSTLTNTIGTSAINWTAVYSKKFIVESKAVLQWNSTDQSLDFIFV